MNRVKPVLSSHTKRDKTKVLKTSGSLMKVESIAECSTGVFYNTFNRHEAIICLENIFLGLFLSDRLRQVYCNDTFCRLCIRLVHNVTVY